MDQDKPTAIIEVPGILSAEDAKAIARAALTAPRRFEVPLADGQTVIATETRLGSGNVR